MLSWAVGFKFLFNKIIANTCLFILTSFSKQSASWMVLEICELCALSADSRKTYSVNKYMYTGSSSYSFDWGGGNNPLGAGGGGGRNGKDPQFLLSKIVWIISLNMDANPNWACTEALHVFCKLPDTFYEILHDACKYLYAWKIDCCREILQKFFQTTCKFWMQQA